MGGSPLPMGAHQETAAEAVAPHLAPRLAPHLAPRLAPPAAPPRRAPPRCRSPFAAGAAASLLGALLASPLQAHPPRRLFEARELPGERLVYTRLRQPWPVRAVVRAPDGTLWAVDGRDRILARPPTGGWIVATCPRRPGLTPGSFTLLVSWNRGVVVASPFSGLAMVRHGSWHPVIPPGSPGPRRVRALAVHQGELWVASAEGLVAVAPETLRLRWVTPPARLAGSPAGLASDGPRLVVVSDAGGLALFEDGHWEVPDPGGAEAPVAVGAMALSGGRVLAGGAGWLREWHREGGHRDLVAAEPRLGRPVVSALAFRGDELWVGTLGQGVLRRRNGQWQQLLPPHADIASAMVHGLTVAAPDEVLVASDRGLTRVQVVETPPAPAPGGP